MTWDDGVGDYVARIGSTDSPYVWDKGVQDFRNPHPVHEFQWGTSEVITALIGAGLVLEHFAEYPFANGFNAFDGMKPLPGRRWTLPDGEPEMPLMYSIIARKPGA
jgi:hypothetical protein